MAYSTPADLRYTPTDEWVRVEGETATIGVTDYAQHSLSDIVYVELPTVGRELMAEQNFGSVESVKAASDLNMPITGTVSAVNSDLESTPELVNSDPYGRGWFIKITASDFSELQKLMDSAAYAEYCEKRG